MAFDEGTIVEIVRHRLGIPDASHNARIIFQIPTALEQLARKIAANPRKRKHLLTFRDTAVIAVVNGAIDLAAYNLTAAKRFLLEYLHVGSIFYSPRVTGAQSIAAYDLIYKVDHGLLAGEGIDFPSELAANLPGAAFAYDTAYYVIIPTQAFLDTTGFVGALPKDYFRLASTEALALAGTQIDMNFSNLSITFDIVDSQNQTDKLEELPADHAKRFEDHPFYGEYCFFWMDGGTLRVLDAAKPDLLSGRLHFAVPFHPTLTQLAAITELHGDFLEKMLELCAGPGNDAAEDGEH